MSSADLQTVVIACPHCGTRYQVARATLGLSGRAVQCAHCQKSWQATAIEPAAPKPAPPPAPPAKVSDDTLFDASQEVALDRAFEALASAEETEKAPVPEAARDSAEHERMIAEIKAAVAPKPKPASREANVLDPAAHKTRKHAFLKRQDKVSRKLPFARFKRAARFSSVLLLTLVMGGGLIFRANVVRQFPALAGLYGAVGLPVNVIGLEFRNVQTLLSLTNGKNVMKVSAQIYSVSNGRVVVPPVLITLANDAGQPIYQWSVTPAARDIEPGEVVDISSQVTNPPEGATRIKLSFTNARNQAEVSAIGALASNETH